MDILILVILGVMPALVVVGGVSDLTTMKIPNWISLALLALFPPVAWIAGLGGQDILIHFGVALAALCVGIAMFAFNWIGGGDAKLMSASCLWLGLTGSGAFLLWTGVAGGLFCLALIMLRQRFQFLAPSAPGWAARLLEPKGDVPYGVAIAIGALMAYPNADLVAGFAAGR